MDSKTKALQHYFGYNTFKDGQEALIDAVLNGQDCLGIMPTGAGKSICFQLPALLFSGITLVVSPLISLMKDQVNALTQNGVKAAFLNSSLSERQYTMALANARNGEYKIIYVAPERLESPEFLNFALQADISMLTVDEAHCISQWGQDFRPSYLQIAAFIEKLPTRPVVSAFTATATHHVREDIAQLLKLHNPKILITGFDRENLYFKVEKPSDKKHALLSFLQDKKEKQGIIYCATRKTVEDVCQMLTGKGYKASRYHAGLSDGERHNNQDDFLYDRVQMMVATNAFGMGIDKSNVGFVVHYNMPKNIESYYQEAGRAGRDGQAADCLLFYNGQDVRTQLYLIDNDTDDIKRDEHLKELDRKRLKEMTFYCHTQDCLRGYVLRYFGENAKDFCGNCHNCLSDFKQTDVTAEAQKIISCVIKSGERFGVATIIDVLRGSKNERTKRSQLQSLSTYNISTLSAKALGDIVNHLVLNQFLFITDEKFPILKRGKRADEILRQGITVEMKVSNDMPHTIDNKKPAKRVPINNALFNILKDLRMEIANKQNVPAFVIFPDSALADMCAKLPTSNAEFLAVSGVGEMKLTRYGSKFMAAISEFVQGQPEAGQDAATEVYTPQFSNIEFSSEPVTVSVIADKINCILLAHGMEKISGQKINDLLVDKGYLQTNTKPDGKTFKTPTSLGTEAGIIAEQRNFRGESSMINLFNEGAQRLVVEIVKVV